MRNSNFNSSSSSTTNVTSSSEAISVPCIELDLPTRGVIVHAGRGSPIRVVVMSDIHSHESIYFQDEEVHNSSFPTLPIGEILIIAGDLTQSGQLEEFQQFNSFLRAICEKDIYKHIIFIAGNHERTLDEVYYRSEGWRYDRTPQDPIACRDALFSNLPSNVHYLQDSLITVEGLRIHGTPWVIGGEVFTSDTSPAHFRWGFSLSENSIEEKWNSIPADIDILVTHQPPFGAGDIKRNYGLDIIVDDKQIFGFEHKGSMSLMRAVKRIQPILHVCGHEHQGYGAFTYPDCSTLILNASVCDEDVIPSHSLLVVDLDPSTSQSRHHGGHNPVTMEIISNGPKELTCQFDQLGMDLYITTLLAFHNSSINLSFEQQDILHFFLRLITSPPDAPISHSLLPPNHSTTRQHQGVFTSFLKLIGIPLGVIEIKALVLEYQKRIYDLLDSYTLLSNLYSYRRLSKCANVDSAQDFRSMQLVIPQIFLGSEFPAQDFTFLKEMKVTHIINLSGTPPTFPTDFEYLTIDVEDSVDADIARYFPSAIQFIENALLHSQQHHNEGNILIHCHYGVSRSPTILIAYLMHSRNISLSIAHSIVKRARGFISINEGFIRQLMETDHQNTRIDKLTPLIAE